MARSPRGPGRNPSSGNQGPGSGCRAESESTLQPFATPFPHWEQPRGGSSSRMTRGQPPAPSGEAIAPLDEARGALSAAAVTAKVRPAHAGNGRAAELPYPHSAVPRCGPPAAFPAPWPPSVRTTGSSSSPASRHTHTDFGESDMKKTVAGNGGRESMQHKQP